MSRSDRIAAIASTMGGFLFGARFALKLGDLGSVPFAMSVGAWVTWTAIGAVLVPLRNARGPTEAAGLLFGGLMASLWAAWWYGDMYAALGVGSPWVQPMACVATIVAGWLAGHIQTGWTAGTMSRERFGILAGSIPGMVLVVNGWRYGFDELFSLFWISRAACVVLFVAVAMLAAAIHPRPYGRPEFQWTAWTWLRLAGSWVVLMFDGYLLLAFASIPMICFG